MTLFVLCKTPLLPCKYCISKKVSSGVGCKIIWKSSNKTFRNSSNHSWPYFKLHARLMSIFYLIVTVQKYALLYQSYHWQLWPFYNHHPRWDIGNHKNETSKNLLQRGKNMVQHDWLALAVNGLESKEFSLHDILTFHSKEKARVIHVLLHSTALVVEVQKPQKKPQETSQQMLLFCYKGKNWTLSLFHNF